MGSICYCGSPKKNAIIEHKEKPLKTLQQEKSVVDMDKSPPLAPRNHMVSPEFVVPVKTSQQESPVSLNVYNSLTKMKANAIRRPRIIPITTPQDRNPPKRPTANTEEETNSNLVISNPHKSSVILKTLKLSKPKMIHSGLPQRSKHSETRVSKTFYAKSIQKSSFLQFSTPLANL